MAKEAVIVGYGRSAVARAFKGSLVPVFRRSTMKFPTF